jgi:hypothetical protein
VSLPRHNFLWSARLNESGERSVALAFKRNINRDQDIRRQVPGACNCRNHGRCRRIKADHAPLAEWAMIKSDHAPLAEWARSRGLKGLVALVEARSQSVGGVNGRGLADPAFVPPDQPKNPAGTFSLSFFGLSGFGTGGGGSQWGAAILISR